MLTFTTLWANSADAKLAIFFFFFFSPLTGFDILCKLSPGDNLHKMSNPVSGKNKRKYFKISSAKNFTQSGNC